MNLIEQIKKVASDKNMSRYEIAKRANTTVRQVSNVFDGNPTIKSVQSVLDALGKELTIKNKCK